MFRVHFMTPVGEFVAQFDRLDLAEEAVGSEYRFKGINGEILIIPVILQQQSVIVIS